MKDNDTNAILGYLFTRILPQYKELDDIDHGVNHIMDVILRITKIAVEHDLNVMICLTIAIWHDLGQQFGSNNHEMNSAKLFMKDKYLSTVISESTRQIIKGAIEDHRSSKANIKPRSIYGYAISEADRDLSLDCILPKYVKAGRKRYQFDAIELTKWAYNDLLTKYGENGYVTFWLNTERNINDRNNLRTILTSYDTFAAIFKLYLQNGE